MKKSTLIIIFILINLIVLTAITFTIYYTKFKSKEVSRFASVTGIRPEKIEYYKKLHKEAWPMVLKKLKEINISNYSIYIKKINDKYYLFSYFEYSGKDIKLDLLKMSNDPITKKWWMETDPCQVPLPDAKEKGQIWSEMIEIFHLE